jgi:hypothetical protein
MKRFLYIIALFLIVIFIIGAIVFTLNDNYGIHFTTVNVGKEPYTKQQINKLEKLAENGSGDAAFFLVGHYSDYEDNPELSSHWLEVAASNKHPRAMLLLGEELHESHKDTDVIRGAKMLDDAATLGNHKIKCNVGRDLANDPRMRDRAIYWLRISTRYDCERGIYELGKLLVDSPPTREEGINYLDAYIANFPDCKAKYVLGKALYDDINSRQRAVRLFNESAMEGCPEAGSFLSKNNHP